MIIDCHTHIFSEEVRKNRGRYLATDRWFGELYQSPKAQAASEQELFAAMDEAGVDKAVLCGFGWSSIERCRDENDYVLDCTRRHPKRLIGFAAIQPKAGEAALAEMERCVRNGMRGVGEVCPDGQDWRLDDKRYVTPVAELATILGVPLLVHTTEPVGHAYHGKGTVSLPSLYALMSSHPQLRLILGHWGGGFPFYELMPEVSAAARNVSYDTAASLYLYRDAIFPAALTMIGRRKILFGSDFPLIKPKRYLDRLHKLGLATGALTDILGDNAARLLGLDRGEREK